MILISDCNSYHLKHHIHPILEASTKELRDDDMYVFGFWVDDESHVKMYEDKFAEAHHIVIHWAGSDIIKLKSLYCKDRALKLLARPEVRHLAPRSKLADEVSCVIDRDCKIIPTPTNQLAPEPFPLPEKFAVGVYYADLYRGLYGLDCTDAVIKRLPDVPFYLHYVNEESFHIKPEITSQPNVHWLGKIPEAEYLDFLKKVSVLLRLTSHDGMPYSVVEYQCAGRYCITQQKFEHCLQVERDPKQVIAAIKLAQSLHRPNSSGARHWRAYSDHSKFCESIQEILR